MKKLILLCSAAAVVMPAAAIAQSTGSQDFEDKAIIVTGTRTQQVGGIQSPDSSKAKAVVTQELIARSSPGQNVLDTINVVPGVSFQNNDAFGNSGGTLTIRGFDSTRISYTLDGVQLNDSGNYNIFSNFSIDPELIDQVNVNLGSTDVDSPTASAVGGTINQRTRTPARTPGARILGTLGDFDYQRLFVMIDTGDLTSIGTRAFVAGSISEYSNPFNNYGKLARKQLNAKIYQPVGSGGDFFAIAGRYNRDRNNFFGSLPLRTDPARIVGSGTGNRFPTNNNERQYTINAACSVATPVFETRAPAGTTADPDRDAANTCGTEFDRRYNPSNSVNFRGNSRLTLADGLVLTVDPSFQYTKANGGGTSNGREFGYDINPTGGRANCATAANSATVSCVAGYYGGSPYAGGVDLNGDGDRLDTVTVLTPSQTRTRRYAVIAGLRYDVTDSQTVRVSFTHDYANHRQTGEVGLLQANGEPTEVFAIDDPVSTSTGFLLEKRDRQSYAVLNQVAAEYRGEFGPLTVNVGARLPFFKRDLENYCLTSSASGFVECTGGDTALNTQIGALNPTFAPSARRVLRYKKFLPNVGLVYDVTGNVSAFASYSKGLSVPSTDNLYNAFFFPAATAQAKPAPETTDSFDGGLRYRSGKIQAQVSGWYTKFNNRLASAFDPDLNVTVYRNLGKVTKYGIDGSVAYKPVPQLTAYLFGSWTKSKIADNIQTGTLPTGVTCDTVDQTTVTGLRNCAFTAGQRESGSPVYSYGTSAVATLGPVDLGVTAKRTGKRFVFDDNRPTLSGDIGTGTQIFTAAAPAYWLVNVDARLNLKQFGMGKTYLQLNVYNVFDEFYVGGFGGGLTQATSTRTIAAVGTTPARTVPTYGNPAFVQIGAPRTFSASINLEF